MTSPPSASRRRLFAPEVVQTSAMDCGPATLKCLLDGFGVPVSYGRLREACQTDVDGTSIDTIEEIASQLGLEGEQTVLPVDHLFLEEARALPALVVVRFPNGLTHFVVVWRRHGPLLQLMDPASGRRWTRISDFRNEVYVHEIPIPASAWRRWAEGDEFLGALRRRLSNLRVQSRRGAQWIDSARADAGWKTLAGLDAATRMVEALVCAGGLRRGDEAARGLEAFFQRVLAEPSHSTGVIPAAYWSVQPALKGTDGEEQVMLRGAVLIRVLGKKQSDSAAEANGASMDAGAADSPERKPLSPELVAALAERPTNPARELFRFLRADGILVPTAIVGALVLAAGAIVLEAILLRGLFDVGRDLTVSGQRLGAMFVILGFAGVLLLLELPLAGMILRLGRRLETRLRVAFLEKIPRLVDRYFQSRLMSDMAERSHAVQTLRGLPDISGRFLRACFELLFTAAGIAWLDPASAPLAILVAVVTLGLPRLTNPLLTERDLRLRTHVGALARFYLDGLLGLVAIRAHGAERAVRAEHESLLVEWVRAGFGLQRTAVLVEGVQSLVGVGFAVCLLFGYLARTADAGGVLLLVFWALNIPFLAEEIALIARQYPALRSVTLRLLEPLGAPEEAERVGEPAGFGVRQSSGALAPSAAGPSSTDSPSSAAETKAAEDCRTPRRSRATPTASIELRDVTVRAGGHTILEEVSVRIQPGEHVAIVGPSGAGKSSFVGLLLGWHRPANGTVLIDGCLLDVPRLERLRDQTAWVDPTVQLWNRSLLDNLRYGADGEVSSDMGWLVQQAELLRVLQKLPEGLQTRLGEAGGLVSGGEGQRVRFGRALLRRGTRLAILDEPFRGLDRDQRRVLMERARAHWRGVTLLCITHDVGETRSFDRVLVFENGRLVEDDTPAALAKEGDSRYAALLCAEEQVRRKLWSGESWRHHWLEGGRLVERSKGAHIES